MIDRYIATTKTQKKTWGKDSSHKNVVIYNKKRMSLHLKNPNVVRGGVGALSLQETFFFLLFLASACPLSKPIYVYKKRAKDLTRSFQVMKNRT